MIDLCINMPGKTDQNSIHDNMYPINNEKNSPSVWNKVVNTIKNSHIDVDKLIKDSISYGLDLGLFQQGKGGVIVSSESSVNNILTDKDKNILTAKKKIMKPIMSSNKKLKSMFKSKSRSFSILNTALSREIKTRRNIITNQNGNKPSTTALSLKRRKKDHQIRSLTECGSLNSSIEKPAKIKCVRKEMVRPIPICAYCLGDEVLNKRTKIQEDMIACWDCGTCAHPTCLQWPSTLLAKVRNIRWQCLQCKCCSYCGNVSKKDDDMLLCDSCDQGFHMYCFNPPIKALPKGEWICRLCKPVVSDKENITSFSMEDFNFTPNCQIITIESVKALCSPKKKVSMSSTVKKRSKIQRFIMKSQPKIGKRNSKISLLHRKKNKLVARAVHRRKSTLTDGLTMFFTPGNKRTSRVSKQSLTSNSLNNLKDHKSFASSSHRDRNSILSRTISRSSMISDSRELRRTESVRSTKENLSVYESPSENDISRKSSSVVTKSDSKESSPISAEIIIKKRGRKRKIPIVESITPASVRRPKKNLSMISNSGDRTTEKDYLYKNDSTFIAAEEQVKKRGRKKKVDCEIKVAASVAEDASVSETSSLTMSRIEHSSSQSVMSASDHIDNDPYPISDLDRQWFAEIQQKVAQLLPPPMDDPPQLQSLNKKSRQRLENHSEPPELSMESRHHNDSFCDRPSAAGDAVVNANKRFPPRIQIGKYIVDTWYSAPYPSEYARLNVLYICEYCLKHIKSYEVYVLHMEKCTQHFPPGNEIYRNGDLSVFEVDGYVSKLYCQQLCLLAKLFLDHKTLYYDVEPFLFYVAVISKNQSCHIIGYFSKEKRSTHKYNLSCIMVLPPYQKYNYGRFLIDFSYLLSRNEGQSGSPEKPLSTLGRLSYESYWKSKIIPFMLNVEDVSCEFYRQSKFTKPPEGLSITIDRVSTETGINPHDVASTLQLLSKTIDLDDSDRITIQLDWERIKSELEKYATRYPNWVPLDPDCLRWAPLMPLNDKNLQPSHNTSCNTPVNASNVSINMESILEERKQDTTYIINSDSPETQTSRVRKSSDHIESKLESLVFRPSTIDLDKEIQSQITNQDIEINESKEKITLKKGEKIRRRRFLSKKLQSQFDSESNSETIIDKSTENRSLEAIITVTIPEEIEELPPKLKPFSSCSESVRKTRQNSGSTESKSDREPILTPVLSDEKHQDSDDLIDKRRKPRIVQKRVLKIETKKSPIRRLSVRQFSKDQLNVTTRSRRESEKSLIDESNVSVNIVSEIVHNDTGTDTTNHIVTSSVQIEKEIIEKITELNSPIVLIENIKGRGLKPRRNTAVERSPVTSLWWVRTLTNEDPKHVTSVKSSSTKNIDTARVINDIAPIHVDLTSDNSDDHDSGDCTVIPPPTSRRQLDWRKSKPVLEKLKESMTRRYELDTDTDTDTSKLSPSTNVNEPSPVSCGHTTIPCPTLEVEDDSTTTTTTTTKDSDFILRDTRLPLIILEKCDLLRSSHLLDGIGNREINITVSRSSTSNSDSPELLKCDDEILMTPISSEQSKDEELSSNSLPLPSDISLNEEFNRFYNDGHVFNSITSHSSDRDANESLLSSVSNGDTAFSCCDSSLNCLTKLCRRLSPCQSDVVCHSGHVSSTTFVNTNAEWNSPIKHLETLRVLVDPLTPIVALSHLDKSVMQLGHAMNDESMAEDDYVNESFSEMPLSVGKMIVSSSEDNTEEKEENEKEKKEKREQKEEEEEKKEEGGQKKEEWEKEYREKEEDEKLIVSSSGDNDDEDDDEKRFVVELPERDEEDEQLVVSSIDPVDKTPPRTA